MSGRRIAICVAVVAATATGCGQATVPGSTTGGSPSVVSSARSSASVPSVPSSSASSPPASYDGPMLPAGQVTTADRVPWAKVGQGWYLTSIDQGTKGDYGSMNDTAELLDLVDPLGGRYQLLKVPVGKDEAGRFVLEQWSPDSRTALLLMNERTSRQQAVEVDLTTGARTSVAVPLRFSDVRLDPDGSGVVAIALSAGGHGTDVGHLDRIAWDGTDTRLAGRAGLGVLTSPDGSRLVVGAGNFADRTMQVVSASDGAIQQTLTTPFPCVPQRWWNATTLLAQCYGKHLAYVLYLVPLGGGAPTPLSLPHGKKSRDLGDFDARQIDSGLYLQSAGPCGYFFVAHQLPDGRAVPVSVPHAVGNVWLIGGSGSDLVLQMSMSCDGDSSRSALLRFDPVTRAERVLSLLPRTEAFADILTYGEPRSTNAF
ncbi:MAG: hypothetical protein ACRDPI_08420 [Nocardioidaceae bacterium]